MRPGGPGLFGVYFEVPLGRRRRRLAYIIHRGDEKDPGPDQFLQLGIYGHEVWQLSGADPEDPYILPILSGGGVSLDNLDKQQAYWVDEKTIVWPAAEDANATLHAPLVGKRIAHGRRHRHRRTATGSSRSRRQAHSPGSRASFTSTDCRPCRSPKPIGP